MSKENSIIRINNFLKCYNQEALDFLELLLETYSSTSINKGDIMKLIFNEKELKSIDSALPIDSVNEIKKILPTFNNFSYVMNYNGNSFSFGEIQNLFETLHIKTQTKLNHSNFDKNILTCQQ